MPTTFQPVRRIALALLAMVPAVATADTPPRKAVAVVVVAGPPGSDVVTEQPAPPPPLVGIARHAALVGGNQGLVTGTAITVPKGKVDFAIRTVLPFGGLVSVAAGVTSTTELWADAGKFSVDRDDFSTHAAGVKQVLARTRNLQLAVTAAVRNGQEDGDDEVTVGSLGAVLTLATDDGGLAVSTGVAAMRQLDDDDDDGETFLVPTASVSVGSQNLRVMAEWVHLDEDDSLGFLGVRLGSPRTALDVGMIYVPGEDLVPLPVLSLRTRL